MEELFKKLEGREWDWFDNINHQNYDVIFKEFSFTVESHDGQEYYTYSLADLLANKSFNHALWGKLRGHYIVAFAILHDEGEKACIKYILKTML